MISDASFDGFPVAALDFYDDLEQDNSKAFWDAHRSTYEESVRRIRDDWRTGRPLVDWLATHLGDDGTGLR